MFEQISEDAGPEPIPTKTKTYSLRLYSAQEFIKNSVSLRLEISDGNVTRSFDLWIGYEELYKLNFNYAPYFVAEKFFYYLAMIGAYTPSEVNAFCDWIRAAVKGEHYDENKKIASGGLTVISVDKNKTKHSFSIEDSKNSDTEASKLSGKLPGVKQLILPPCGCWRDGLQLNSDGTPNMKAAKGKKQEVWGLVQHLNDTHKWSREKIADWLDDAHDAGLINIEF